MKALTQDDIRDIAIRIVGEMVENHIIKDCTDTDDTTEFDVQDIIVEHIKSHFIGHPVYVGGTAQYEVRPHKGKTYMQGRKIFDR
tara:strand:- start:484 stop:738 length:255 start_codon:yes stop_codon:yes gene_type:complete